MTKFLVEKANVAVNPTDRWNSTPLDDAIKYNRTEIIEYLKQHKAQPGATVVKPGAL